jgi:hypothetical protein
VDEMRRACSSNRNAYRILAGEPKGERPLGRPRRRWVNNIKIDLKRNRMDGMDWIALEGFYEHGNEPSGSIKCWEVPEWLHN